MGIERKDEDADGRPRLSDAIADAVEDSSAWRHRCLERITIDDDLAITHELVLEVSIPATLATGDGASIVPLLYVAKSPTRGLLVNDERGHAVPTLTRAENGEIAETIVLDLAAGVARMLAETQDETFKLGRGC